MTQAAILAASGSPGTTTGFKNRIINGNMVIDQRNAGATVTPTNASYTLDRWKFSVSQASKLTVGQSSTAPAGFSNSMLITSSSAYSSVSGDYFVVSQKVEGFNSADLNWGTSNAKTITISFWVQSSLTGTFSLSVLNSANNRSYPVSYTINAANTWEYKSVTIPGDTTGTWIGATNGIGLDVYWDLGTGSTYEGTSGVWAATNYYATTGSVNLVGTSGATLYITGVQLEVGTTATNFDFRSYSTELNLCLRYYYMASPATQGGWNSGNSFTTGYTFTGNDSLNCYFPLPVPMRATPTNVTISAASTWSAVISSLATPTSVSCTGTTPYYGYFAALGGGCAFGSNGLCARLRINSSNSFFDLSAEL